MRQRLRLTGSQWRDTILGLLLGLGTALLYLWKLTSGGYANAYYAAAVQAGTVSLKAAFYGSFDASNAVTVDKPPASLWLAEIFTRIFGFSSFTLLLPEVLVGASAVVMLFILLRAHFGWVAGLVAGLVLAFTPVAALMFRFDNPDALLALLMVLSVWATFRLYESGRTRWALVVGLFLGLAVLTKGLQAFLILPALALPYLLLCALPLWQRVKNLLVATAALVIAGGWWFTVVALTPASQRPYIGSSKTNSVLEILIGYNGVGRLTGQENGATAVSQVDTGSGVVRLFTANLGGQIAWLLPLAFIGLFIAAYFLAPKRKEGPELFQTAVWGMALLTSAAVFSLMKGIFHPYYTIALAPYIAALVGVFVSVLWRYRDDWMLRATAGGAVVVSAIWASLLLRRGPAPAGLTWWVIGLGIATALTILLLTVGPRLLRMMAVLLGCLSLLAGPAYYTWETLNVPHLDSVPTAGPDPWVQVEKGSNVLIVAPEVTGAEVRLLREDANRYRWVLATFGGEQAAGYQLASGKPVLSMGGFNTIDPYPSFTNFKREALSGSIHYVLLSGDNLLGPKSNRGLITQWVREHYKIVTVNRVVFYDLSTPRL